MLSKNIRNTIIVASLGYFVDIYDLIIFSIVRKSSLTSIGLNDNQILNEGLKIINAQMLGMLIGGIIWGIIGDKKGRLKVLFGSIILYSIANIANAYVNTINYYLLWRFIAGLGLAGELGAGITLVAEIMPKEKRGYGTSIVAGFGILGAVLAYAVSAAFDWRSCYLIGGILGLSLLLLRLGVLESELYIKKINDKKNKEVFFSLFTNKIILKKYLQCIGIGIPIWYVVGILISFSDKFAKELNIKGEILPSKSVLLCYLGLAAGDFISGLISQFFKSRKKTLLLFFILLITSLILYFTSYNSSKNYFYFITFILGLSSGYWAIFVTIGAEQFGTNIRSTIATTVPNFVRGALPLISLLFVYLQNSFNYILSAVLTGVFCLIIATLSLIYIKETFNKNLDYNEFV